MHESVAPEALASKAVNQYRGRDVFSYLALRYCLQAPIARKDSWSEDNAIQAVLGSPRGRYLRSYHFKSFSTGQIEHRQLMVPGPTEALAEAVLLSHCAKQWEIERYDKLFSYFPTEISDRQGYFAAYMIGLRSRQRKISEICLSDPEATVSYFDIEKFYPSITPAVARYAWDSFAVRSLMSDRLRRVGEKLISNHAFETDGRSILTGPMFSHFIANLVLKVVDDHAVEYPATYIRYVDDITLVGSENSIRRSVEAISDDLAALGLSLHKENPNKTLTVSAREWITSSGDFHDDPITTGWMRLVSDIKKLLIFRPDDAFNLEAALLKEGFRFPIPDYTLARRDRSIFEKVRRLGIWGWLFAKSRNVSIERIVSSANSLRDQLEKECSDLFGSAGELSIFQRKRRVSKLRYRLGRLAYLSSYNSLSTFGEAAQKWPELAFHSALLRAIVSGDCSRVIEMGSNVSQAAGQIFRATGRLATFSRPISSEAEHQGLAILLLNGVSVEATVRSIQHPLVKFAAGGVDLDLITYPRGFVQEIACLHGLGPPRHIETMRNAFDLDQDIILDALEFDYGYYL